MPHPPALARRILAALLPAADRTHALQDLDELFQLRVARRGAGAATRWYLVQCLSFPLRLGAERARATFRRPRPASWGQDLRYAARGFRRAPGFFVASLLTLALGIGATTTIFSLAYGIWLKPLPFADPGRLVTFRDVYRDGDGWAISAPEVQDLRQTRSLQGAAIYGYGAAITTVGDEPVRLTAYRVSTDLFPVLGVTPARGRFFAAGDEQGSQGPVLVMSDAFWRKRFDADPAIVGKPLELNGKHYTVIGVAPRRFRFPQWLESDVWIPFDLSQAPDRSQRYFQVVGRLRPGVGVADARTEMTLLSKQLESAWPASNTGWSVHLDPLVDATVGSFGAAFKFLLGTVGLLLLIACANIASLFLARNTARHHELAVRTALGAGRGRLRKQIFAESLLLSMVGGAAGLLLARFGAVLVARMMPPGTPRVADLGMDWPVVLFALTVSSVSGILCALAPSSRISTVAPGQALRSESRTSSGSTRHRLQNGLVIGQVAISLMLLVGAGLTLKSFFALVTLDRGFRPEHILTLHLSVPFDRYGDNDVRIAAFQNVLRRVGQLPGVEGVGAVTGYPGSSLGYLGSLPVGPRLTASLHASSPDYFKVMGVPLLAGRGFSDQDRLGAPRVAVVNRSLAQGMWPGQSAVGKTVTLPASMAGVVATDTPYQVVGVVGDMHLGARSSPEVFVSAWQAAVFWSDVIVRTTGDPAASAVSVRQALRQIDPGFLIEGIAPMESIVGEQIALPRVQGFLGAVFGALAALLSAVGLYGLLSYMVGQRLREISIHMALGASVGRVFRVVLARGMGLAVIGVTLGGAATLAVIRLVRSRVFGLRAIDPVVVAGAAGLMLAVAFLASYLPARRATRADPITSLR